jgi:sucrose-6-phosphate hydrolase SacC (GH32 family)
MKNSNLSIALICSFLFFALISLGQKSTEQWRPKFHFSPKENWTNDPNGLVYFNGYYHLFFQHNPVGIEWGNMSWGHAKSKDLRHWEELPVAIPNDSAFIFSGCVVVDKDHKSGLGDPRKPLFVAIYTADFPNKREEQHLAYSNDEGLTWTKYDKNPILDIQLKDFRDPNVFWHEASNQFIMAVAKPREYTIQFYGSKNLIQWKLLSEFGQQGDVEKIWECPSLVQVPIEGKPGFKKWVLFVSSQGPYKEYVGMQYFVGEFNGTSFKNEYAESTKLYVDYGKDFYAAIPFSNVKSEKPIWLGWASNWAYVNDQPTYPWRGQMSSVRELSLFPTSQGLRLKQVFKPEISRLKPIYKRSNFRISGANTLKNFKFSNKKSYLIELEINSTAAKSWGISIRGKKEFSEEQINIGFDEIKSQWFVDRKKSGKIIHKGFLMEDRADFIPGREKKIQLFLDHSVLEVLAQNGLVAISSLRFPLAIDEVFQLFSESNQTNVKQISIWSL